MDKLLQKFNDVEGFHWWWEGRRALVLDALPKKKSGLKILDIGCGTGETLLFIKNNVSNAKVFGLDRSKNAVLMAKKRGINSVVCAGAVKLPFSDSSFDVVLLLDVLEHIKNDKKAILEASRVLKKDGIVIITSPANSFIWSDHDLNQGHFRRYTKELLFDKIKGVGLSIEKISYFNFTLFLPIVLIRLCSNIKPLKFLSSYDNNINFEIAKNNLINSMLKNIFVQEVKLLKFVSYPFGISLFCKLAKK